MSISRPPPKINLPFPNIYLRSISPPSPNLPYQHLLTRPSPKPVYSKSQRPPQLCRRRHPPQVVPPVLRTPLSPANHRRRLGSHQAPQIVNNSVPPSTPLPNAPPSDEPATLTTPSPYRPVRSAPPRYHGCRRQYHRILRLSITARSITRCETGVGPSPTSPTCPLHIRSGRSGNPQ